MAFHRTLIALCVLAALLGFVYYYEYLGDVGDAESEADRALVFDKDAISEIHVALKDTAPLDLQRTEGRWEIASPIHTRADDTKVETLINNLRFLRVERRLEAIPPGEREGFGLASPAIEVRVGSGEGPGGSLAIGDEVPAGGGRYATQPGQDEVLLLGGSFDTILDASVDSLRMKSLFGIDAWRVRRLKVSGGGRAVTLEKTGGTWSVKEPIEFPADAKRVEPILSKTHDARASRFEAEDATQAELAGLGLAPGPEILDVTLEDDQGHSVTARIGSPSGFEGIAARRDDMSAVMIVPREVRETLEEALRRPETLRDMHPAVFNRFMLTSLHISTGEDIAASKPLVLFKDDASTWHRDAMDGPSLESEKVNRLLDALEALEASRIEDAPAGASVADRFTIVLKEGEEEGAPAVTVVVQDTRDDQVPVRTSRSGALYLVSSDAAGAVSSAAATLLQEPAPSLSEGAPAPGPPGADEGTR